MALNNIIQIHIHTFVSTENHSTGNIHELISMVWSSDRTSMCIMRLISSFQRTNAPVNQCSSKLIYTNFNRWLFFLFWKSNQRFVLFSPYYAQSKSLVISFKETNGSVSNSFANSHRFFKLLKCCIEFQIDKLCWSNIISLPIESIFLTYKWSRWCFQSGKIKQNHTTKDLYPQTISNVKKICSICFRSFTFFPMLLTFTIKTANTD